MQITTVIEAKQPVYKPGDHFVYRVDMSFSNETFKCTVKFTVKIIITKIEWPYVTYTVTIRDVSTDCPEQAYIPSEGETTTETIRIDMPPSESFKLFVDPSYSGEFKQTGYFDISANYKNGVLISGKIKYKVFDVETTININLIDTSVPGLITPWYLIFIIIGAIIAVGVIVVIIILKKARKPPQPTPPPPLPPTVTTTS